MLWGCLVVPGPRGTAVVVPALPTIVELDVEPYYFYSGYYYYYNNDHYQCINDHNQRNLKHYSSNNRWNFKWSNGLC